jgi:hypothetical protein
VPARLGRRGRHFPGLLIGDRLVPDRCIATTPVKWRPPTSFIYVIYALIDDDKIAMLGGTAAKQGRDFSRAARYHHQAGRHALSQHGYREAAGHLTRALDSLKALPDSPARRQQELALHLTLGSALLALKGHVAPEVEQAYARARELREQVDDDPRLLPALRGLGRFYLVRGSLDAARGVGQRLRAMAESTGHAATSLAAHDLLGHVSFYGGGLEAGLAHLERAIELCDPTSPAPRGPSTFRLILDAGVSCTAHAAWSSWMLGYPARAAARMREALARGSSIAHPFSLAHACRFAAALHHLRRERAAAREQAEASVAVSAGHASDGNASPYYGYGAVLVAANFHRGWALVDQGRQEQGLAAMRAWVKTCRDTGAQRVCCRATWHGSPSRMVRPASAAKGSRWWARGWTPPRRSGPITGRLSCTDCAES